MLGFYLITTLREISLDRSLKIFVNVCKILKVYVLLFVRVKLLTIVFYYRSKSDYATTRQCSSTPVSQQHTESCYAHTQNVTTYAHYQHRPQESMYRNCSLYANMGFVISTYNPSRDHQRQW